ncbi:type II toxin-antitoxin system RelE/ParE family toxin [Nostoc sp. FACHB-87]|uniref:type II toxin-antitoxin system RelE/ParE family toxin n=1 Tax=Nostocales TaxID=1161 RepID=UPI0016832DCB|nr:MULTISPECIES: type II toxin-antitoxin system RelE/ParE family toxin [Nostocales]MBD2300952.1 type II toxin-antitoxin system RelE/ParE family toxin [Nostoc sp. FACHB-190]MBD2452513.1 type II toxin-antitoxin system RelE/ParE family toxin [Nostoc sp. FACHB-87]MBD2473444.1 type II toxin-antitoxin system RelE/ParE family toxin [Anabaena sp. FACHB-83]MBD2486108.1 type II toxin-antitoxin system RelE/ParE family toxin [Aulosira sp. FACHB-615]
MSRFKISQQAIQDIENIWNYIAEKNPQAADKLFDKLREKFPKLAKFPQLGKPRFDLAASLRCFPVENYLIFYRSMEQDIEIVRILHGAQDIESIFQNIEDTEDI